MRTKNLSRLFILTLLSLSLSVPAFAGATITIINLDGANEGFNDSTPAAPVGGNAGTTLGQQRLIAFTYAANIWGATLDSAQTIRVQAAFNPLAANVLGSAGAIQVFSDFTPVFPFPGPEFAATWYSAALADKRAGFDLDPTRNHINAQFSSNFIFYLGLDRNHGTQPDLVTVLLHELGHGLGFQNFVNEATGTNLAGQTDVYSHHTLDLTNGSLWNQMTDAQRQASAVRSGRVVWDGANVTDAVPSVLLFGSPEVRVLSPAAIAGSFQFGTAAFGPVLSSPGVTGFVVAAVDAANTTGPATTDGCTAFTNAAAIAGNIALIERGTCGFVVKAKVAQNAGAVGVIIYNNAANAAAGPVGMAGVDPTITISSVLVSRADGLSILTQTGVTAKLSVDLSIRAGADPLGRARLFMPFPVQGGSSGSHYDSIAFRNLLMEPAINNDLTHSLKAPEDMTLELMRDIGWFADADLDGLSDAADNCPLTANGNQADNDGDNIGDVCDPDDDNDGVADAVDNCPTTVNADQANFDGDLLGDLCDPDDDNDGVLDGTDDTQFSDLRPTVIIAGCDSGATNTLFANGSTLADRILKLHVAARNHGQFMSSLNALLNDLKKEGVLPAVQKGSIDACAAKAP